MPRLKKGFSCRVNQEITVFKSHFIVLMIHINNNRRFGTTYTGDKKSIHLKVSKYVFLYPIK